MTVLDGAFWVSCLVLVAAGTTKLTAPDPLARALAAFGLTLAGTRRRSVARTLGAVEVLVGLAGLVVGGAVVAGAAGVLYAAFAAVVLLARRRGLSSCGCFGERSGPPTTIHAALNIVSAAICAMAVAWPVEPVSDVVASAGAPVVWGLLIVLVATAAIIAVEAR